MSKKQEKEQRTLSRPSMSPEAAEKKLVNLAMQNAEEMLLNRTAPPSIVLHFLKLGSSDNEIDQDLKKSQAKLARTKAKSVENESTNTELMEEALRAFKGYAE